MQLIFKIIFCLFLTLSFNFADEIKDNNITLQEQNLTKQVDDLCEAIMDDDYDKVKAMIDENPELINVNKNSILSPLCIATTTFLEKNINNLEDENILNLLLKNGANPNEYIKVESPEEVFQFSYPAQILKSNINFKYKINLLEIFKNYGLDLNSAAIISDDDPVYLPAFIILYQDNYSDDDFEIFDYLAKHRVKPDKALSFIVFLDLGRKTNELFREKKLNELEEHIKSSEYLNLRDKYKKYFISAFSNYKIDDFKFDEILDIVIYFIVSKDDEILELLTKNGFINDEIKVGIEKFYTQQVDELNEAIMDYDYDKVKAMLDENPKLANLDDGYFKPLDYVLNGRRGSGITEKRLKIFEILISKNIDLNYHVGEGFTPLQLMTLYFDESYLENFIIKNIDKIDMNLVYKKRVNFTVYGL